MSKNINVKETRKVVNGYGNIEDYEKEIFFNELNKKIQEGEEDIKAGRTYKLRDVLEELKGKYGF